MLRAMERFHEVSLEEIPEPEPRERRVLAADGAAAALVTRAGNECLEVRDRAGRVLFEYDPETGCGSLSIPVGDLELCAAQGDVVLRAGRRVRLEGARGIELEGDRLGVRARRGEFELEETRYVGRTIEGTFQAAKLLVERMESVVGRLIERARHAYRYVEKLNQLKAGRQRVLVEGNHHAKAGSTFIKSDGITKIDGSQIHMG